MAVRGRNSGEGEHGVPEQDNVVPFPRDWVGSPDELVPIAGTARAGTEASAAPSHPDRRDEAPEPALTGAPSSSYPDTDSDASLSPGAVGPDDFWGEQAEMLHQPFALPAREAVAFELEREEPRQARQGVASTEPGSGGGSLRRLWPFLVAASILLVALAVGLGTFLGGNSNTGANSNRAQSAAGAPTRSSSQAHDKHRSRGVGRREARSRTSTRGRGRRGKVRHRVGAGARQQHATTNGSTADSAGAASTGGDASSATAGSTPEPTTRAPVKSTTSGGSTSGGSASGGSNAASGVGGLPGPGAINPAAT